MLQALLAQGVVPVIPPLGFDGDGGTYRVNSDAAAVAVAAALKAIKVIYLTTADGLIVKGELLRQVSAEDLEAILKQRRDDILPESVSKAQWAVAACRAGVERVHVVNGREEEGLLAEVFSNEGIGTLVHANEYQQIRPARKKDIQAIQALIRQGVEAGELVERTRASIEQTIGDYYIFEIDRNPVACVALHVDQATRTGELASLYVNVVPRAPRHRPHARAVHRDARQGSRHVADLSRSRPRRSRTSSRRPASSRGRPTICRPRAASDTSAAAAGRRCSSRP